MNRPALEVSVAGHPGMRLRHARFSEPQTAGVSLVKYSTPCMFAAQTAIDASMKALVAADGRLPDAAPDLVDVKACNELLHQNLLGFSLPKA